MYMQGLYVCGTPHMTIFSFASADKNLSVFALADLMETKGELYIELGLGLLHT